MVDMDVSKFHRAKPAKKHKAPRPPKEPSSLEKKFMLCISGLPKPEREHRFHPTRRWRFDFVWIDHKLAVEIDGGAFMAGRHNRAIPQASDCEKVNAAILLGWRVLKFNTVNLKYPLQVRATVEAALGLEQPRAIGGGE